MTDSDYPANQGQTGKDASNEEPPIANEGASATEQNNAAPTDEPQAGEAETAAGGDGEQDAAGGNAVSADEQVVKLKDQLMRLAAELENTRRRSEREKRESGQYAIASFARDLISVADNFERALRAAGVSDDQLPEGHSETFNSLVAGIQLTEKELLTMLNRHGVQKLEPSGEKFDPNVHQAVANVPSAVIEKGCVVDVAQPGFTIGERVLRAAMVTVSSGAPAGGGDASAPGSTVDEEA